MTAEERLQELYEADKQGEWYGLRINGKPVGREYTSLNPSDIDLIADLVVERLKNEKSDIQ